jgi:hypothetical protein
VKGVFAAALEIQEFLSRAGAKFCFIGGVALQRWGQPRLTQDVDLTLLCGRGEEAIAIDWLLAKFAARLPDARDFALRNRVLLLQSGSGAPIDVSLGAIPLEHRCVARASEFDFGAGFRLLTCSAEDLIVLKAFASRPQDWIDIEAVVLRQHRMLDWKLVFDELEPLVALRETPEVLDRLRRLRQG